MYIYIYISPWSVYLLAIRNTDYSRKWDFVCNVLQSLNSESAPRYNLSIPVSFLDTISSKFINRDPSNLCVCIYDDEPSLVTEEGWLDGPSRPSGTGGESGEN